MSVIVFTLSRKFEIHLSTCSLSRSARHRLLHAPPARGNSSVSPTPFRSSTVEAIASPIEELSLLSSNQIYVAL